MGQREALRMTGRKADDAARARAGMARFFRGWTLHEPCAWGFGLRGECPERMAEQILSVELTEDHGPVSRIEIRCPKCGAVWAEARSSE